MQHFPGYQIKMSFHNRGDAYCGSCGQVKTDHQGSMNRYSCIR